MHLIGPRLGNRVIQASSTNLSCTRVIFHLQKKNLIRVRSQL